MPRRFRVGLTGGIGSGKSTVADQFTALGAPVIDADIVAREQVQQGSEGLLAITQQFGTDILTSDGDLDRNKLRVIVFSDPQKRGKLESILHPLIRKAMELQADQANFSYVIFAIPLLIETGRDRDMDRVLVVDIPEEEQIRRVSSRDGHNEALIKEIMSAQCSRQDRLDAANDVLTNLGPPSELQKKVQKLHDQYLRLSQPIT